LNAGGQPVELPLAAILKSYKIKELVFIREILTHGDRTHDH